LVVEFVEGEPLEYLLPVLLGTGAEAEAVQQRSPQRVIARLRLQNTDAEGILYDAIPDPEFCRAILHLITRRRTLSSHGGELRATAAQGLRFDGVSAIESLEPIGKY
jgi:hypothetical protein